MNKQIYQISIIIIIFFVSCGKSGDAPVLNEELQWYATFGYLGDDRGNSVQQTSDGGYIVVGETESLLDGNSKIYLVLADAYGNEITSNTFEGAEWSGSRGYSVQQTTDRGYIVSGMYSGVAHLIKTDERLDELWSKTFEGNWGAYSVQQTTDGGYIITGFTVSDNIFLIKTDGNGNEQWSKTFGGGRGRSVQQTTDGGYIITGYTSYFGNGFFDAFLLKTDNNGDSLWMKTFGGTGNDRGYSVRQTTDGGYIIVGTTEPFGLYNGNQIYLLKTNENGTEQWSQTFGEHESSCGYSVQQTTDGGYIIVSNTSDYTLLKTDGNGNEQWSRNLEISPNYVQQTTDRGYIITGTIQDYDSTHSDVCLIKTDAQGNVNLNQQ